MRTWWTCLLYCLILTQDDMYLIRWTGSKDQTSDPVWSLVCNQQGYISKYITISCHSNHGAQAQTPSGTWGLQFPALRLTLTSQEKRQANLPPTNIQAPSTVTPLPPLSSLLPHPETIDTLYGIQTTTLETSFLARLQGTRTLPITAIAIDWETITPWMNLMNDIREHYKLSQ